MACLLVVCGRRAARGRTNVETDPLQCWWRTSAGAVRVGEPFTVVLTCAVLETDAATVVVDQSRLEPSVVQFAPFEVLGGSHGADLRTDQRRFFQYDYRLRLIAENLFGKDVSLPETKLSYHVQSKVGDRRRRCRGAIRPTCCRRSRSACCRSCRPTPPTFATRPAKPSATSTSARSAPTCSR